MKLVIVESPTKARTISGFLGEDYKVESSYGHVRDLPKSRLGIDVENNFLPSYIIPLKARARVKALKKEAEKAEEVILATDEDREGEAIAWHLIKALDLGKEAKSLSKNAKKSGKQHSADSIKRIVFHEITKPAIEEALKTPRAIDSNLVAAQQARRVLDRLVGYKLSPFLWKKIRSGLSAGRVQSVALRLIVEREREVENFHKEEYWTIEGEFSKKNGKEIFLAKLYAVGGKTLEKLAIKNELSAKEIAEALEGKTYSVSGVFSAEAKRNPAPPLITSTLQQEANRRFGFSAKRTMVVAQALYENGLITYMRTDSSNIAESALRQARETIEKKFGKNYLPEAPQRYKTRSRNAQEAHEAIRPTDLKKETIASRESGWKKLYELVWQRTVASQMKPAIFEKTAVDLSTENGSHIFRANGQILKFDGFLKVYGREINEEFLPPLEPKEGLDLRKLSPLQHFTEPPPRYTDASLVKILEANGIGRPSTYAPVLSTIQGRDYVRKIERKYQPTEIGILVNDLLVKHFPEIVDVKFTAQMEEELDEIAAGEKTWEPIIREFYEPFQKRLSEKEEEVEKHVEISETPCPHCGKPMLIKFGRYGKFLACPDPESRITLPLPEEAERIKKLQEENGGEKCPLCGKIMEVKRGRFGYFLGCVDYPKCKGIKKILKKMGFQCPACLAADERRQDPGEIVERRNRNGRIFYGCSRYPECKFLINKKPESEEELKEELKKLQAKKSDNKKPRKKESGPEEGPR